MNSCSTQPRAAVRQPRSQSVISARSQHFPTCGRPWPQNARAARPQQTIASRPAAQGGVRGACQQMSTCRGRGERLGRRAANPSGLDDIAERERRRRLTFTSMPVSFVPRNAERPGPAGEGETGPMRNARWTWAAPFYGYEKVGGRIGRKGREPFLRLRKITPAGPDLPPQPLPPRRPR